MDVRASLSQCYYQMTVSEIRMMNNQPDGNISYNSVLYLDIIAFQEKCTVSSLANTLRISKSAVTQKVNELVRRGMVTRTRSENDKRVSYLTLSPETAAESALYERPFARAVQAIEKIYTNEQLAIFCAIMNTFSAEFAEAE